MSKKKRTPSSARWLKEHFSDEYVKLAQKQGYRSRAAYKLIEILQKNPVIKAKMTVVDLGAAPGGWSQVAADVVGEKGTVVALDLLEMDPIAGVEFIQGDFTEQAILDQLVALLGEQEVNIVLSDMAPNLSGMTAVDQPRFMCLADLALDFCQHYLAPGGCFIIKIFQGEGIDDYIKQCRSMFNKVVIRKPKASRDRSREQYIVGIDKRD